MRCSSTVGQKVAHYAGLQLPGTLFIGAKSRKFVENKKVDNVVRQFGSHAPEIFSFAKEGN